MGFWRERRTAREAASDVWAVVCNDDGDGGEAAGRWRVRLGRMARGAVLAVEDQRHCMGRAFLQQIYRQCYFMKNIKVLLSPSFLSLQLHQLPSGAGKRCCCVTW